MNKTFVKNIYLKVIVLMLAIAIAVGGFISATSFAAKAETTSFVDFPSVSMDITNNQFLDYGGSSTLPGSPSGWNAAPIGDQKIGQTVAGVVDLKQYNREENRDAIKLDAYPEYANNVPVSPFGTGDSGYKGTNKNILMVNTTKSTTTAYGFSSSDMTFAPNKYYMVSAFVKTGNFADNTGASIRLVGMEKDIAFTNINTVVDLPLISGTNIPDLSKSPLLGFKEYKFFIATPSMKSSTVNLRLAVGDNYTDTKDDTKSKTSVASGYAFFDNINAFEISPTNFYSAISSVDETTTLVKDFSNVSSKGNWNFENGIVDDSWTFSGSEGDFPKGIYNANVAFTSENEFSLNEDPVSALGKGIRSKYDSNILVLSSLDKAVYAGYKSKSIEVKRLTFFRVSVWTKVENTEGGSGATVLISSDKNKDKLTEAERKHITPISSVSGDPENKARYGWKEQVFYIKGSSTATRNINLELWLGQEGSPSKGKAMFDNVRVEEITSTEYSDNSSTGTIVNLDDADSFPDTGITNGEFYVAGDYDEYKFPLPAASWTKVSTLDAGTKGYSSAKVETKDVISGLMPTDYEHFNEWKDSYGGGVVNPRPGKGNVLYISSSVNTAVAYRSSTFSVAAKTSGKLTVSMNVANMAGYGASLVLKNGDKVVSSIENITKTDGFDSFTFVVEGGLTDTSTLSVEIWLGLNDRVNNTTKLGSGNVYVDRVAYTALAEGDSYLTYKKAYEKAKQTGSKVSTAAYSLKAADFSAFDYYQDSFVKYPYNWDLTKGYANSDISTVVYGIFDSKNVPASQTQVPTTFKNSKDATNNGVLMLQNVAPTSSKLTLFNKTNLAASSFFKVSVTLKVDIPAGQDGAIGAGVELVGTDFKFSNILNTNTVTDSITDKETFKTYTFYISTAAEAADISVAVTLGGSETSSQACFGRVYVNNVDITDITNVLFEEETKALKDKGADKIYIDEYNMKAAIGEVKEVVEEKPKTEIQWWLIPSILFGIAILIALVGVLVRRIMEKTAKKKKYEKVTSYDRTGTLEKIHNNNNTNEDEKINDVVETDTSYDALDENAVVKKEQPVVQPNNNETDAQPVEENNDGETEIENTEVVEVKAEIVKPVEKQPQKPSAPSDTYTDSFDD